MRVVTLNLWGKQGDWPGRLGVIRRELERLQPDVVALQEVLLLEAEPDNHAAQVAHSLGYLAAYGSGYPPGCFGPALAGAAQTHARSIPYAAPLGEPDRRIHYVLSAVDLGVSPGGAGGVRRGWPRAAGLCFTTGEGDLFASDHYGIY